MTTVESYVVPASVTLTVRAPAIDVGIRGEIAASDDEGRAGQLVLASDGRNPGRAVEGVSCHGLGLGIAGNGDGLARQRIETDEEIR